MENFVNGLIALISDPVALVLFIFGLFAGMVFGAIPGLNAVILASILLPFTAYLSATNAILLLAVIYVSGVYGGAITAILFNIPGAPENAPTTFDGYPMTLRGEAGKAIGAAVIYSALGGAASAVVMMVATAPIANWAIGAFGPPELFALIVFGLTVAGSVGAQTVWKGWLSVAFGLLLATIGTDAAGGLPRFTFGSTYLMAGITFVPLVLGFFAVSEILVQSRSIAMGTRSAPEAKMTFPTLREFWNLKVAAARSIAIGFFAGLLPGIGAVLAAFLSYSEARRWSSRGRNFGRGELEGVVASEAANNAATGAAMIPLLALGLPGGALTAVMVGAFQMHGIEPGPLVLVTSKDLVWVVFVGMFLASLAIIPLGYVESKTIVHLLRVPFGLLAPTVLLTATIGAYALRNLVLDVWIMYLAGVVGFFMRRTGYSMPSIVLGVILGAIGESAFVRTMQMLDYNPIGLLGRPISAILIVLAIASFAYSAYRGLRTRHEESGVLS